MNFALSASPLAENESGKRHRAAAVQDLAEQRACNPSRQRPGVRQPYAAFTSILSSLVIRHSSFPK
jgi:hypothetical protein